MNITFIFVGMEYNTKFSLFISEHGAMPYTYQPTRILQ